MEREKEGQQPRKLKIAFFGNDFSRQGKGTALVMQRIAGELLDYHADDVEVVLLRPDKPAKSAVVSRVRSVIIKRKFSTALSYFWFFLIHRDRYDVVVFNRNVYPGFWFLRSKKFILFMHDASQSEAYKVKTTFANFAFETFLTFIGQFFLDAVIAISDNARGWIIKRHHLEERRVKTIYAATGTDIKQMSFDERALAKETLFQKYGVSSPYLLEVARLDPHKNVARVVDAYVKLKKEKGISETLVLAGGRHDREYTKFVEEKISASPFGQSVQCVDYISPEDMSLLYGAADAFVFPSLMEGFGMPVVEAFACGTPVVTSNISCLPEIAGGAALLVDPLSVDSIADGIEKILTDKALRDDLVRKGLVRARDFSWRKSTDLLLAIIRE